MFYFYFLVLTQDATSGTHFSTTVLQQDVDVLLVLKVVIKMHDVFVVQDSVQLDFSVDLHANQNTINSTRRRLKLSEVDSCSGARARLPSPVGEVWRRAREG